MQTRTSQHAQSPAPRGNGAGGTFREESDGKGDAERTRARDVWSDDRGAATCRALRDHFFCPWFETGPEPGHDPRFEPWNFREEDASEDAERPRADTPSPSGTRTASRLSLSASRSSSRPASSDGSASREPGGCREGCRCHSEADRVEPDRVGPDRPASDRERPRQAGSDRGEKARPGADCSCRAGTDAVCRAARLGAEGNGTPAHADRGGPAASSAGSSGAGGTGAGASGTGRSGARRTTTGTRSGTAASSRRTSWSRARPLPDDGPECATPKSDPILVVSRLVPGVRYLGVAVDGVFHVVLSHLAALSGSLDTQFYRGLRARVVPGWQIWRLNFRNVKGCVVHDTVPLRVARSYLDTVAENRLTAEERERLEDVRGCFLGDGPEGELQPLPYGVPADLTRLVTPRSPLRALWHDGFCFPLLVGSSGRRLALDRLAAWYRLDRDDVRRHVLNETDRRVFRPELVFAANVSRERELYVPVRLAPACLAELADRFRARGRAWERLEDMAAALEEKLDLLDHPTGGFRDPADHVRGDMEEDFPLVKASRRPEGPGGAVMGA